MLEIASGSCDKALAASLQNTLDQCSKETIESDRLRTLLNDGNTQKALDLFGVRGALPINGDGHGNGCFSRVYLSYVTRKALNLHRFHGYEDKACYACQESVWKQIEDQNVDEMEEDVVHFCKLYQHTQAELERFVGNKRTVNLFRVFRGEQEKEFNRIYRDARENGEKKMVLNFNTFDFFSLKPWGHGDSSECFVVLDVPIESVIICSDTVEGFHSVDRDYLVAFPSPTGLVEISVSAFNPTTVLPEEKVFGNPKSSFREMLKKLFLDHVR